MKAIVAKFGGSSVANAQQIEKVAGIIRSDPRRRIIVVSAPGKMIKEDEKITDILISCHTIASNGKAFHHRFSIIRERFHTLADELGIGCDMDIWIDEVEANIADGADRNAVVSRGEYLCAQMIARYLGFEFIDAAKLIEFSTPTKVDRNATDLHIAQHIKEGKYVIPGFYGTLPDGRIQLFTRGGSDISGSLIAKGIDAELYENWTDVSGLLSTDPRIVKQPKPIATISYRELRELAFLGAEVFHQEAIAPVAECDIPINIRNTNDPRHPGTMITHQVHSFREVTGVAGKTGYRGIYAEKDMSGNSHNLMGYHEYLLHQHSINLIHTSIGCDSMFSLARADDMSVWKELPQVLEELFAFNHVDTDIHAAVVGGVGINISRNSRILSLILHEFAVRNILIYAIRADYSPHSFMLIVPEKSYTDALTALYDATIRAS